MIEYVNDRREIRITIPNAKIDQVPRYYHGLRGILGKIEIGNCEPELMENLKVVFDLLTLLGPQRSHETDKRSSN